MEENKIRRQEYDDSLPDVIPQDWATKHITSFSELSVIIKQTHETTQTTAIKAINRISTLRNWLIGYYIIEFEQNGKDRAVYGDRLLKRLEESVATKGSNETLFKVSRIFYRDYPQIRELLSIEEKNAISAMPSHEFKTSASTIIGSLSFSHIQKILTIEELK